LLDAGRDPHEPMEVWRGTILALKIRSIGKGARLTVIESTGDGVPRFGRAYPT
jgi:hypothetical protein